MGVRYVLVCRVLSLSYAVHSSLYPRPLLLSAASPWASLASNAAQAGRAVVVQWPRAPGRLLAGVEGADSDMLRRLGQASGREKPSGEAPWMDRDLNADSIHRCLRFSRFFLECNAAQALHGAIVLSEAWNLI